jgi:hypothetical protein
MPFGGDGGRGGGGGGNKRKFPGDDYQDGKFEDYGSSLDHKRLRRDAPGHPLVDADDDSNQFVNRFRLDAEKQGIQGQVRKME